MYRSPAAGRNWEGYGEDTYLASVASKNVVAGIASQGVLATISTLLVMSKKLTVKHLILRLMNVFYKKFTSHHSRLELFLVLVVLWLLTTTLMVFHLLIIPGF